ncbi:MAG: UvrD-helicase domain-containing protein [Thermoleophilia bacterium]|nr:UvrD-helicase domain-containing protein [Thermoleophilia bacterium]
MITEAVAGQLSKAQRKALLAPHSRLLVSAGAGSGKTRLLVAHLVRALAEDGISPEKLVAVTFTRAAAAEIAARARQELVKLGRHDLARDLDAATIGTIHSLCHKLVREYALILEVDPHWSVADEQGAAVLKERAQRAAWDQLVAEADQETLDLLAREAHVFEREAPYLYDRLRTLGNESPKLVFPSQTNISDAKARLAAALEEALSLQQAAREGSYLAKDLATLRECLSWLAEPPHQEDPDDALITAGRFYPSRRTPSAEHFFGPVREALFVYRCALAQHSLQPVVEVMNRFLGHLHEHYQALKRTRGVLDFNDLELYARRLVELVNQGAVPGPLLPGGVVLVDEFQDTNELQCGILEGLGASRIILVGDERQSIYRFRGADVTVFRRRRRLFEMGDSGGDDQAVVTLDENYRSTAQILAFVNKVFSSPGFFGANSGDESDYVPLRRPNEADVDKVGRPVEILLASRLANGGSEIESEEEGVQSLSIQEAEAQVIAQRVEELVTQEGWQYADIAVLLPAYTSVEVYQQALLARGLPVYVTRGRRFYSRPEILDMVCFLRLLVNCHDDLALAAVLRSPLVGLTDDALFLLGHERASARKDAGEPVSLWSLVSALAIDGSACGLPEEDAKRLAVLVERYHELRSRVARVSIASLIEQIVNVFDYDLYLLAGRDGKRRFANLRKLMRIADEYESLEGPDLAGFVMVLKARAETEDKEPEAPTLGKGENVIQVSTVHQAKGLEFPCVVVGGLGSTRRRQRAGCFAVGDDGRMAVFKRKAHNDKNEPCDPCWGPGAEIEDDNRQREAEEDIRLLYVAMTRAKEHLILVGAVDTGGRRRGRIQGVLEALGVSGLDDLTEPLVLEDPPVRIALVRQVEPAGVSDSAHVQGEAKAADRVEVPLMLEPVPEVVHPRQISFSALALYQTCPRWFYLERVLGLAGLQQVSASLVERDESSVLAPDDRADRLESQSGVATGLLVHALLQRFGDQAAPPPLDLMEEAVRAWLSQFGGPVGESDVERAFVLTRAFWESPVREWVAGLPCSREAPFAFEHEGILVSGVIDLLGRSSDCWYVVDYKTNRLDGRSSFDLMEHYEMQGTIYSLAALKAGAPQVKMIFLFLEQACDPVVSTYNPGQTDELEEQLSRVLSEIKEGKYLPNTGPQCAACPFSRFCK